MKYRDAIRNVLSNYGVGNYHDANGNPQFDEEVFDECYEELMDIFEDYGYHVRGLG